MIFISGNVPSSKNSKEIIFNENKPRLINSKTVRRYIKNSKGDWLINKQKFLRMSKNLEKPFVVKFYFVRDSRRKFDYNNASQILTDLMTDYRYIEDDNCTQIIPKYIGYEVNKNKAGVYIDVEPFENDDGFFRRLKMTLGDDENVEV